MTKSNDVCTNEECIQLYNQQAFVIDELDYSVLERHKPNLQRLAETVNSEISVFDNCKKTHVFRSSNLGTMLGYNLNDFAEGGDLFLDTKIHPDDFTALQQNATAAFKLFCNFSIDEKLNHKFVSEYRVLNASNNYVRVVEQHQVLELDNYGNVWLTLSILDISPNQDNLHEGVKCQPLNFRTGKILYFDDLKENKTNTLTKREIEIIKMIKDGYLSKEISDRLTISLHTVNTHRQKILEKLGASNSMEAVMLASKLGLI